MIFKDKIENVFNLITDCKSSYEKFAKDNNVKLEQVKSGTYVNLNGYSLGNINSLHSEWSNFRGVLTKHLHHYLDWFSFQKLINYTVEILKQPITIMKNAMVKNSSINSNNMFDNSSENDFDIVYAKYNFHPPII